MRIQISSGVGTGPTEMAAFDHALVKAGVANFNLIYLSSVVPPGSELIVQDHPIHPKGSWGDRLYVVMSQIRTSQRHQEAWAGIGWMQDPKTQQGLLVEHEGHNETEVRADIESSLKALAKNRKMKFGPIDMRIAGARCEDLSICALVVAVFESSPWQGLKNKSLFSRR